MDSASAPALADADSVKTNLSSSLSVSETQRLEDVLIFSQDKNEQFAARRALRLGLVAPAPPPPDVPRFQLSTTSTNSSWPNGSSTKLPQAKNPPPICDDTTFVRRVYLDIIGVIPTATEEASSSPPTKIPPQQSAPGTNRQPCSLA